MPSNSFDTLYQLEYIMKAKEIWLKAIMMEPLKRIPFWPKLWSEYPGMQKQPFSSMSLRELHAWIGSDYHQMPDVHTGVKPAHTTCAVKTFRQGRSWETNFQTPSGEVLYKQEFDEGSRSWHPVKHPVQTLDDIKILTEYFNDLSWILDDAELEKVEDMTESIGEDGLVSVCCGTSPLMEWVEYFAGVENAHLLLMDYPDEVELLFSVLQERLLEKTRLICKNHPADILYYNENTSTSLISPTQYDRYCFPHLTECSEIIRKNKRLVFLHMCGHLKRLLPTLAKLDVDAFEAFSTAPLTDQSLLDGRTNCPQRCLIGGTNAVLWTKSAAEITEGIKRELDALPHHRGIVITSGGAMPPQVEPDKIKAVCDWLKEYPARM